MSSTRITPTETAALTRQVTLLSVATATVLVTIKAAAWLASDSTAMLASMADSGLDLVASLATAFAVRYAVAPPDAEHRYGHGKAEAFASLIQAGLVFASAALIAREAVGDFLTPHPLKAEGWAVAVMAISTVLTGLLLTAQTRVLRRTASVAVSGDRAHYASDLASNVIALIGIAASAWLGVNGLDAAAAMAIAALLLWSAVGVFREAANQLMDRELPDNERAEIVALASADPRLTDIHQLRTRASGPYVHIQMHAALDPDLTLEAAHEVIVAAEKRILEVFPAADIIIHADPRGRAEPHGGAFAESTGSVAHKQTQ
ncbi:MAG: cation diffusion facilitator family transporter [Alphaproteobacteria bacterium]|nr:cation diffusion facilitator family transporter [Alphaproteobacteria bacterium]MBU1517071.1 cation diffusion facilitator family transporter [Alphaproteobacteria bacterium]MBU2093690.1 cation diffusion facilitator family transporter [Alphaproteobacteria bacterium]MBU2153988.1 cation diffusion facilitator family transporter [Alphaproteobacteria bacterium]MBU2308710.1 cation diffusion facilitator family transporter [Alphaproteobacteria bacterium]